MAENTICFRLSLLTMLLSELPVMPKLSVDNTAKRAILAIPIGDVVQLGERLNGIQEVRGSTPLVSILIW